MSKVFNTVLGGGVVGVTFSITVNTNKGATVTLTSPGGKIKTAVATTGSAVFNKLYELGDYTITASLSGKSNTSTLSASTAMNYTITVYKTKVPDEYQELSYIESTGTQYIDTKLGVHYPREVVMDMEYTALPTDRTSTMFGLYGTNAVRNYFIAISNSCYSYGSNSWVSSGITAVVNDRHTFDCYIGSSSQYMKIDGKQVASSSITTTATYSYNNIPIFGYSQSGSVMTGELSSAKLYSCQIKDDDKLVYNFIPCYRKSDGEVGLYDTVTETFFTNSGTGSFRMGAIIDDDFTDTYQQVEYLQSSGTQYIEAYDSAITNGKVAASFELLKSGNYALYGCTFDGNSTGLFVCFGSASVYYETDPVLYYNKNGDWTTKYSSISHSVNDYVDKYIADGFNVTRFLIFDYTNVESSTTRCQLKLYNLSLFDNSSSFVRLFIPCYRKSDSVAGLYDMVNKVFYTNQGTGTFAVGSDVDPE